MQDAETGQRGYLLTSDVSYLEPYYKGSEQAQSTLQELEVLVSDNPIQLKRLADVKISMEKKFKELHKTITAAQAGNIDEALALVKQNTGKWQMDNIRTLIREFISTELVLLERRKG